MESQGRLLGTVRLDLRSEGGGCSCVWQGGGEGGGREMGKKQAWSAVEILIPWGIERWGGGCNWKVEAGCGWLIRKDARQGRSVCVRKCCQHLEALRDEVQNRFRRAVWWFSPALSVHFKPSFFKKVCRKTTPNTSL